MSHLKCEKCCKEGKKNFIRHFSSDCNCPMAICMQCLRENSKQIVCHGCEKIMKAVNIFDAKKFEQESLRYKKKTQSTI